jgi:hypothetical protein
MGGPAKALAEMTCMATAVAMENARKHGIFSQAALWDLS